MITNSAIIEALLFWKAEPMSVKKLSEILNCEIGQVENDLMQLESVMAGRGIVLVRKEDEVMLATSPETSNLIEKLTKEELNKDLGKAGLETLSIIAYFGPISRSEIDYIRGVNSAFVLRTLLIRGLIERVQSKSDQRVYQYKASFDLLNHLGIAKIDDLPEYKSVKDELDSYKKSQENQEQNENSQ